MSSDTQVKILLVDDRPENLITLESVLESLDQKLVKANSGAEALKRLLDDEFAVILLDVQMPGMDGFETASLIRSREKTRHIPIIFLTAYSKSDQHAVKGYALGAVDYIFKPFEPDLLRAKVAAFVELSKKTQEWREEIVQRRRAEERLDTSNALLETISRTLVGFISHNDPAVACQNLLGRLLTLMQSEYGFIGEVLYTDLGDPYLRLLAVSNIGGGNSRKSESRFSTSNREAEATKALCRTLLESGPLLLANARAAVPPGLPPGHPALLNFVGLPFYKGDLLVGMLGIGNRPGGYTEEMVASLEPLRGTCAAIIEAYRTEQRRKQAEAAVRELNEDLERRVFERTAALEAANKDLENEVAERTQAQVALMEAKEAAEVANSAKTRFLASMSHELRTPLNAIIGYSEMLQEEALELGQEDLLPDLGKIHAAGKHLLALINDVLDLAKIEAGKEFLSLDTFDLPTLIEQVINTAQPLAQKNGNTLEVLCPPDSGVMRADPTKLRQSLLNLLSNACKFTEQGVITLEVSRQELDKRDWILFRVADTGIGIPLDQMGRLFEPFSQAHTETVRRYGGTGLGLSLTRHYCEMMQGSITVESEPGKGTEFTIRLPREVRASEGQPAIHEPPSALSQKPPTGAVLVIDDDPTARDLMKRFLTKEGIRVKTAASGEEGLRLARTIQPAAITLDVMMPTMDGWAVLSALKADPKLCDIPVIMLTMVDDRKQGYTLGAADYMVKPIDWNRLKAILDRYRCLQPPCPVLIVEDDPDSRQLLRSMLEREGWVVAEAENGRAALDCMQENRPALILLDLLMPGMDGFSLVSTLRAHPDWRTIPVVIITAKDITEEDRRQLNGHVEKILQKGVYSREALLDEVRYLVQTCV